MTYMYKLFTLELIYICQTDNEKIIMCEALIEEAVRLLNNSQIQDFNIWRMKNLTVKLDLSGRNFSGKNLSQALLNGVSCIRTDFSNCNLCKVNLVQSNLNKADFEGANLTDALLMYAEMTECKLINSDITRTNFMWTNLENSDLTGSKIFKTIFVQANLKNVKVFKVDKERAYLKYAKLEGTPWENKDNVMH